MNMDTKRGNNAIKELARKKGLPEEYIRSQMKLAILEGYKNPETREKWNELFGEGHLPTPEEFIVTMSNKISKS